MTLLRAYYVMLRTGKEGGGEQKVTESEELSSRNLRSAIGV